MRRNLSPYLGYLLTCLVLLLSVLPVWAERVIYNPDKWSSIVQDNNYNIPGYPCNYTLFTGNGNWNDAARWSHQPPHASAFAMVNGNVEITEDTYCMAILLGKGCVSVAPGCTLKVKYLYLCDPIASIHTLGNVEVLRKVIIRHVLPEKGEWYFLASPFETYQVQDSEYKMGDNATTGSGNYFYRQTYNSARRGSSGQSSGNWDVVPASTVPYTSIFEKGKGYLFALDAGSNHTEILFSSKDSISLTDFGKRKTINIQVSVAAGQGSSPHQGWYLCGNPLPSSLPLSAIESNPDLDGNVYIYEAGEYKAYPIGSEYAIPLAGSFFVKARKNTTIVIFPPDPVKRFTLLPAYLPIDLTRSEPGSASTPTGHPTISPGTSPLWRLTAAGIHLEQLPATGLLTVSDLTGRLLLQRTLPAGTTFVPVTLERGCYILQIRSGNDCNQYKFVWNNR